MANYEDFKKKAKDAIETIADVSVEAYRAAEEKARIIAKRAKLNAEISRDKSLIRRLKVNIGSKYYELHKDDPEEDFVESCTGITEAVGRIVANKREIEELKKGNVSCECGEACETECDLESEPAPEDEGKEGSEE